MLEVKDRFRFLPRDKVYGLERNPARIQSRRVRSAVTREMSEIPVVIF